MAGILPFIGPAASLFGVGNKIFGEDPEQPIGPPSQISDPAAQQDIGSAQLQAQAAQAKPQGPDPNAQLLQLLLMLANQGPKP